MPPTKSRFLHQVWELTRFVLTVLIIVVPIRLFIAKPFIVSGASMYPTFKDSEYLIVDELSYYLRAPERGDVVIFKYPKNPKVYYIKRVIGLPGETVIIQNDQVFVQKNASSTKELIAWANIDNETMPFENAAPVTVGPDQYFVMGDNRPVSSDSRYWGLVPRNLMAGRAFVRLFPPQSIGLLPGAITAKQ